MYQAKLKEYFGFESLRGGQEEVIRNILNGDSAAAIFATGSGKSLCYQLPALMLDNLTIVISPLLALIKDQLGFLLSKNIPAVSIDSTQSKDESKQAMELISNGSVKVLIISVERLKNERFREFIKKIPISMMVVDEAHCISSWGNNFRPDYLMLPDAMKALNIPQVLLLTATATPDVIDDMSSKFGISKDKITSTGFYRKNLDLTVKPTSIDNRMTALTEILNKKLVLPTIVYVTQQATAQLVADNLSKSGINAEAYHAGLGSELRADIQDRFMSGHLNCVVATIAFGMGVDKSDIRQVIHYDLPKSIESYSQEIGRAGRDGLTSYCTMLADNSDVNTLLNFAYGSTPDKSSIRTVLDSINNEAGGHSGLWEVQMYNLAKDSDFRQLSLKTLLVYLEQEGVIKPKYSYFSEYRFKTDKSYAEISKMFQGEKSKFLEEVLSHCRRAKVWSTVDMATLIELGMDRGRIVAALEYLNDKDCIELESKKMIDVYQVISPQQGSIDNLIELLHARFKNQEDSEVQRVGNMLSLFKNPKCLSSSLSSYFLDNDVTSKCGHCSSCRGDFHDMPEVTLPVIDEQSLMKVSQEFICLCAKHDVEPSLDAIARFHCGIPTPLITRLKLGKVDGFGDYRRYTLSDIRGLLD